MIFANVCASTVICGQCGHFSIPTHFLFPARTVTSEVTSKSQLVAVPRCNVTNECTGFHILLDFRKEVNDFTVRFLAINHLTLIEF